MHDAYEITRLFALKDQQIEAIAAYDGYIFIGTRQGQLLMYSLCLDAATQKNETKLIAKCRTFSKKPIQQLEVIPEDNLLLCLTDNVLSTHDIRDYNFPLKATFQNTPGASLFALNNKSAVSMTGQSSSMVRLCVAVRRKLQLYYGKNGEFKRHPVDFTLADVPKVMSWGQEYLCVGFKAEYKFFDLSTGNPKELFPTSSRSSEPTITKFSETSFLLGRDNTSVLVDEKGAKIINTIKWKLPPLAVVWDEPYLLGLMQEEVIIQTVEPPLFIQSLADVKARVMCKCKQGLTLIASMGQVWCVSSVDIAKQWQQLLNDKQFQIAVDLTNVSDLPEDKKKQKINEIQMRHAVDLFHKKEYSKSMKEFLKLNIDPVEVIKLFPELDNKPFADDKTKDQGLQESALNALIEYLIELRRNLCINDANKDSAKKVEGSQRNVAQQLELIDTTLLKCYIQNNEALIAPLLRLNKCRLDEAERTLLAHGKFAELIILYQMKGQHARALQLLKEQAVQTDSSLRGYQPTKNYLQKLGSEHLNLIFKFSDWILENHPEEGLKIFTEDILEVENLPRASILDFLLREHEALVIPYLEHVIYMWNDTTPSFHDALVTKYREKVTDKKLTTDEEVQHIRKKLVTFLEESTHYTPERMILHFPSDSLFQERAIILGKLGRHEQALAIYVQILGDVEKAVKYCEGVMSSASGPSKPDVYVTLVRILMNPGQLSGLAGPLASQTRLAAATAPDLDTALALLKEHAHEISPLKALSVLPDDVPLSQLKHFLQSALDSQLALKRKTQILKGLLYAEHMQVQEQKRYYESKSVVINDYNVCPVCKKRFGNQSAFVRYPSGDIVHYSCRLDK